MGFTRIQQLGRVPIAPPSKSSGAVVDFPDDSEVLHGVLRSSQQSGPAHEVHRDDDIDLIPSFQLLTLRNLYLHRKLEYIIKNDSLFFRVDVPVSQEISGTIPQRFHEDVSPLPTTMAERASLNIVVRPNLHTLRENWKMIMKQKYIEEHLTIYNRSNPREKYTVSLRLTTGHLRNFIAASGYVIKKINSSCLQLACVKAVTVRIFSHG